MKRTIEEYMALPYATEIVPSDGSFFVYVKELEGCMSVGDTKLEALEMIEDAMREWLQVAIEDNVEIPLPAKEDHYSGKIQLRMPKSLHKKLAVNALQDGVSLNQYMVSLLSERNAFAEIQQLIDKTNVLDSFVEPRFSIKRPNKSVISLAERRKSNHFFERNQVAA